MNDVVGGPSILSGSAFPHLNRVLWLWKRCKEEATTPRDRRCAACRARHVAVILTNTLRSIQKRKLRLRELSSHPQATWHSCTGAFTCFHCSASLLQSSPCEKVSPKSLADHPVPSSRFCPDVWISDKVKDDTQRASEMFQST